MVEAKALESPIVGGWGVVEGWGNARESCSLTFVLRLKVLPTILIPFTFCVAVKALFTILIPNTWSHSVNCS